MRVNIIDKQSADSTRYRTPDGFLRADGARLTRSGIFEYTANQLGVEGSADRILKVYRHPEHTFNPATYDSIRGAPITINHPDDNVTPSNWNEKSVGSIVGEPRREGDLLVADIILGSEDAIKIVEQDGWEELSIGYSLDIKPVADTMIGYHYETTDPLIINHVAIVKEGRAGPQVRIQDSAEGIMPELERTVERILGGYDYAQNSQQQDTMETRYLVDDAVEDALAQYYDSLRYGDADAQDYYNEYKNRWLPPGDSWDASTGGIAATARNWMRTPQGRMFRHVTNTSPAGVDGTFSEMESRGAPTVAERPRMSQEFGGDGMYEDYGMLFPIADGMSREQEYGMGAPNVAEMPRRPRGFGESNDGMASMVYNPTTGERLENPYEFYATGPGAFDNHHPMGYTFVPGAMAPGRREGMYPEYFVESNDAQDIYDPATGVQYSSRTGTPNTGHNLMAPYPAVQVAPYGMGPTNVAQYYGAYENVWPGPMYMYSPNMPPQGNMGGSRVYDSYMYDPSYAMMQDPGHYRMDAPRNFESMPRRGIYLPQEQFGMDNDPDIWSAEEWEEANSFDPLELFESNDSEVWINSPGGYMNTPPWGQPYGRDFTPAMNRRKAQRFANQYGFGMMEGNDDPYFGEREMESSGYPHFMESNGY